MTVVIKELVIKGVVGSPATHRERNSTQKNEERSNRAQITVNMVEDIIKRKKER